MATKYAGYMGRVALMDLSSGEVSEYPWTDEQREKYIGGKMMAARILADNLSGREDAFSEENLLVIATGPLTGTPAPSSNRFDISAISPQTRIIASSNCGGNFGLYLKKAGYDALILRGRCRMRSWLEIDNDRFTLHSAEGLWGLCATPAQEKLHSMMNEARGCPVKCGIVTIGPAGENLVKYSAVISNERAAGRTGMGAVMGWKNLKAITVTGSHEIPVYDETAAKRFCQKWTKVIRDHPLVGNQMPRLGTASMVAPMHLRGILATKNYQCGRNADFEKVSGEALDEQFNVVNKGCLSCPIKCARTVAVDGKEVKGPELESMGLLGGGIMNDDLSLLVRWNHLIDELGMDVISCANTLAWAMEANERGLWDNGLRFGMGEALTPIIEDIAFRRGIGNELAEGSRSLAEKYGGLDFAMQSKGLEFAAYEPRRAVGQGLGYAVANRGACHLNGGYLVLLEGLGICTDTQTPKAKADLCMLFQDILETVSAAGLCLFTSSAMFPPILIRKPNCLLTRTVNRMLPHIGWVVRAINRFPQALCFHIPVFHHTRGMMLITGMKMNFGKFVRCGERGYNTERALDVRFGVSAKDDTLPKRVTDVPQDPKDPKTVVPLDILKRKYYRARGWSQDGVPTAGTLRRLGVEMPCSGDGKPQH